MHNVAAQCERIEAAGVFLIDNDPFTLAVMLGNLYYLLPKVTAKNKSLIECTIRRLQNNLTQKKIQRLWHILINFSVKNKYLLTKSLYKSLVALKKNFLKNENWFYACRSSALIQIGAHQELYRVVMVNLIRRYLHQSDLKDPFSPRYFSYDLLAQGGCKENTFYLQSFLHCCSALPKKALINLAKQNLSIAKLMLIDFLNHDYFFEFSANIVKIYPELEKCVARKWQSICDHFPLKRQQETEIKNYVKKLKAKHPAFKKLKMGRRIARVYQRPPLESLIPWWEHAAGALGGAALSFVALSCLAAPPITPMASLMVSGPASAFILAPPFRKILDNTEKKVRRLLKLS